MSSQWFYARNKQKHGPFTSQQLKELAEKGELAPTDLVIKQGMEKWVPASAVQGLFAAAAAPPAPPKPPPAPAAAKAPAVPPPPPPPKKQPPPVEELEEVAEVAEVAEVVEETEVLDMADALAGGGRDAAAPRPAAAGYEYKILSQKDKWFSRKFDPDTLEEAINAYVEQGWRVIATTTASFPGFLTGPREEMIVLLERPVD